MNTQTVNGVNIKSAQNVQNQYEANKVASDKSLFASNSLEAQPAQDEFASENKKTNKCL